jgi:hypothetical protein
LQPLLSHTSSRVLFVNASPPCFCSVCARTLRGTVGLNALKRVAPLVDPGDGKLPWDLPLVAPLEHERLFRWGHSACVVSLSPLGAGDPATSAPTALVVFGGFMGHLCHNRTNDTVALKLGA